MEYCLNREPEFFKDTKFIIDAFHYKSHIGCNPSFNSNKFPKLLDDRITTWSENQNKKLKPIKARMMFMSLHRFCLYLIYQMTRLNSYHLHGTGPHFEADEQEPGDPNDSVVGEGDLTDDELLEEHLDNTAEAELLPFEVPSDDEDDIDQEILNT
jgi:hypothetical protein